MVVADQRELSKQCPVFSDLECMVHFSVYPVPLMVADSQAWRDPVCLAHSPKVASLERGVCGEWGKGLGSSKVRFESISD